MTSDSQDPDEAASGADWAPPGTDRPVRPEAPRGDGMPPEFAWAPPHAAATSWDTPRNSWTVAYADVPPSEPGTSGAGDPSPAEWSAPQQAVPERPAPPPPGPFPPTSNAGPDRLPRRVPSRPEFPEAEPGNYQFPRYEPAPPPGGAGVSTQPLPPQAHRIPGASLGAAPPVRGEPAGPYQPAAPYQPPNPYRPPAEREPGAPHEDPGGQQSAFPDRRTAPDQSSLDRRDQGRAHPVGRGRAQVSPAGAPATGGPAVSGRAPQTGGAPQSAGLPPADTPRPTWEPAPPYLPRSPLEAPQPPDRPAAHLPPEAERSRGAAHVPAQRSHPADGDAVPASSAISASASVPATSRVSPPDDAAAAVSVPAPQPRVYGRRATPPAPDGADRAEPADQQPLPVRGTHLFPGGPQFDVEAEPPGGRLDYRGAADRPRDGSVEPPGGPGFGRSDVAGAPTPPAPGSHSDRGRFSVTDEPAVGRPRPGGPATGTARPVNPAGLAQQETAADRGSGREDLDHHGRPQDGPDEGRIGPWSRPEAGDVRASGRPGSPVEAPPIGRAVAPSTSATSGPAAGQRFTEAALAGNRALPWADPQDRQQRRLDGFRPGADQAPPTEAPPPQVRNLRVLVMVLAAAVLLLAVPLGTLWVLGMGGDRGFDPAVGSCVKQDGAGAVAAGCGDTGAYRVVSKADDPGKCDAKQPHIILQNAEEPNVLCLRPASAR